MEPSNKKPCMEEEAPVFPASATDLITKVRAPYKAKKFTQSGMIESKGMFWNVHRMREQLGFPCDMAIKCEGVIEAMFKKAFNSEFNIEDLRLNYNTLAAFKESNFCGVGEFLAIVLQLSLSAAADIDAQALEATSPSIDIFVNNIMVQRHFVKDISNEDILHVWYCLLSWPFVFNEMETTEIDRGHFIENYKTFLSLPSKNLVAMYLASERCRSWSEALFADFEPRDIRFPRISSFLEDNAPFPPLHTRDRVFRFVLLYCIATDYYGDEEADESYMSFFLNAISHHLGCILHESDERDNIAKDMALNWHLFCTAFPSLKQVHSLPEKNEREETEDEGEESGEEEEEEDKEYEGYE
jgi:hypothetical protein